jgi:hypothetical protein
MLRNMPLDRSNWPTVSRVKADLSARFTLPKLPAEFDRWFEFARQNLGMNLFLESNTLGFGDDGPYLLDGREVIDPPSALFAMDGYRFILDQKNSSPENLLWTDQVDRGQWQLHWILLDSIGADPIIADVSVSNIPVMFDHHGAGQWAPRPLCDTVADFIALLKVKHPLAPVCNPLPRYTVSIVDFGAEPKRVLLALKRSPAFSELSPAELLSLRKKLPLVLLENSVSHPLAIRIADAYRNCGAVIELVTSIEGT